MKSSGIRPYQIGLSVIAAFTFVMLFIVVVQGVTGRQDAATARSATEIATKLNNYTTDNEKVPDNLATLGVKNAPKTITYKKINDSSYKFCATYKSSGSSLETSGITNTFTELEGGGTTDTGSAPDATSAATYLDVSTHKKGQNCQTINPVGIFSDSNTGSDQNNNYGSGAINTTDPCTYPGDNASDSDLQKYEDCENNYYNSSSGSTDQTTPPTTIPSNVN